MGEAAFLLLAKSWPWDSQIADKIRKKNMHDIKWNGNADYISKGKRGNFIIKFYESKS